MLSYREIYCYSQLAILRLGIQEKNRIVVSEQRSKPIDIRRG